MQRLPLPDSQHGWYVGALSSQGTVVFNQDSGSVIGFWNAASGARVVASPAPRVYAKAMNDAGQVALFSGNYDTAFPRDNVAYEWDSNSDRMISTIVARDFVNHGALFIYPTSINGHGDVAGYVNDFLGANVTAFKWSASTGFRYLKLGEQNVSTYVVALNDAGDAAVNLSTFNNSTGNMEALGTSRGAVWTAAGDLIMLKSTEPFVFPIGINNTGIVAGHTSPDGSLSQVQAQVWDYSALTASPSKAAPVPAATIRADVSPRVTSSSSRKSSSP